MIYTTYYAKLSKLPPSIRPISISVGCPVAGLLRIPELAPDWDAVQAYKQTGDWAAFRTAYLAKLNAIPPARLATLFPAGDIALVCYEKDPTVCHRSIMAEWLGERLGVTIKEWSDIRDPAG